MSFSNISDAWNNDPVREITQKLSTRPPPKNNNPSLSEIHSLSFGTDSLIRTKTNSDLSPFFPTISKNNDQKNYRKNSHISNHYCQHINNCKYCNDEIEQIVNRRLNKKLNEILLNQKIKKLESEKINHSSPFNMTSLGTIAIFMLGIIIVIFILFLIIKASNK